MLENCFAVGIRGTTTISLLASENSQNKLLLIASLIISQQAKVLSKRTYVTFMTSITKALCIPVRESNIPVLLLTIQISAQYQISLYLLIRLLLLVIHLQRKFNLRDAGIIVWIGVTAI